jgi:multidrug efflux pump subunit AcrA (membrane-fusion protein)
MEAQLNDAVSKLADTNRDIALRRSELYVASRQFTIQQAKELESLSIGYHNALTERALNAAKITADYGIAKVDSAIKNYSLKLERWRSAREAFNTQLQQSITALEIYKSSLEGAKLLSDIDRARVENYRVQLAAVETIINIFKTRVQVSEVEANIQRLKIEAGKALVDMYVAQVRAKEAEFGMYKSRIDGEMPTCPHQTLCQRKEGQRVNV